jgi:hypothetical protein
LFLISSDTNLFNSPHLPTGDEAYLMQGTRKCEASKTLDGPLFVR